MTRAYKQPAPLTLRTGALQHELDARSDGTPAGHRATIMRDLARYYALITPPPRFITDCAPLVRHWYDAHANGADDLLPLIENYCPSPLDALTILDAIERAHVLTQHHDYTVALALREVGLLS